MSLTLEQRASIIDKAMMRKFGKLLDWERPDLLHSFGANNLDHVERFENKLKEVHQEVTHALERLSDDDLVACKR